MIELTSLPAGLKHQDDDEKVLALLPILADRMKHHTKRLRHIRYVEGLEGEKTYKAKHPEARPVQTRATSSAWQNKPAGYDDYLATLAHQWLTIDGAVASTNIAEVERLNAHFATTRFSPAKQFSLPLSKSAKSKIGAAFTSRGVPFDTSKVLSMSGVREAAKAANAVAQQDSRPFGRFGTLSGNSLVTRGRVTPIGMHGGRCCIRVTINGARQWQRLDMLEGALSLLFGGDVEDDPLLYSPIVDTGELDHKPESPGFGAPADSGTGELDHSPYAEAAIPAPSAPLSLTKRMAAKRAAQLLVELDADRPAAQPPHSPTCPNDVSLDPLTL